MEDQFDRISMDFGFVKSVSDQHSVGVEVHSDLPLLTLKGIGLQTVTDPAYAWDNRNRPDSQCVIQYTVSGCGAVEADGIHYIVPAGYAFLVDIPGPSRYYMPPDSDRWEFFFLEFTKECLPMLWKIYRTAGPVIRLSESSGLVPRIMDLYHLVIGGQLTSYFENARLSYDFWLRLTEYAVTQSATFLSKVDYAKRFIDQNYRSPDLSLDQIADYAGLSKYYLCKEFRHKFGISPGKYIRTLRLDEACSLLSTRLDFSLQDIALQVGYANDNYFGKVFKAAKGISPDQYRKHQSRYDTVQTIYETPSAGSRSSPKKI